MTSPIDAVGPSATLPANYDPGAAKENTSGTGTQAPMLDSKAFLQLLVAQLKYQDPTNPVDTSSFMNQTAMLSQVQTMNTMSGTLTELMTAQQTASATSMIGKAISFVDPAGKQVTGLVDGVSFHQGAAMLHVGELAVPLAGVLEVADPSVMGKGGGTGTGGTPAAGGTDGADGTTGTAGSGGGTTGTSGTSGTSGTGAENGSTPSDSPPTIPGPTPDDGTTPGAPPTFTPTIRPDVISA